MDFAARQQIMPGIPDERREGLARAGSKRFPAMMVVVNENWRGKNDPTERRRIQNRINQRAFRQRQLTEDCPRPHTPCSKPGLSPRSRKLNRRVNDENRYGGDGSEGEVDDSEEDDDDCKNVDESPHLRSPRHAQRLSFAGMAGSGATGIAQPDTHRTWDELARLINRNLMAAAATNAQHLGLDSRALRSGTAVVTPRTVNAALPASLRPVELQHQVPHDPIIDILPHPRLRANILTAFVTKRVDPAAFCRCIRASGAVEETSGGQQRGGLVVWSSSEHVSSWEFSETFLHQYAALLQGCDDLIAATNSWRRRRGEAVFA